MDRRVSLRAEPASVTPSPARIPMAWPDCRRAPAVVDSSPPASACKVRAAEIWPGNWMSRPACSVSAPLAETRPTDCVLAAVSVLAPAPEPLLVPAPVPALPPVLPVLPPLLPLPLLPLLPPVPPVLPLLLPPVPLLPLPEPLSATVPARRLRPACTRTSWSPITSEPPSARSRPPPRAMRPASAGCRARSPTHHRPHPPSLGPRSPRRDRRVAAAVRATAPAPCARPSTATSRRRPRAHRARLHRAAGRDLDVARRADFQIARQGDQIAAHVHAHASLGADQANAIGIHAAQRRRVQRHRRRRAFALARRYRARRVVDLGRAGVTCSWSAQMPALISSVRAIRSTRLRFAPFSPAPSTRSLPPATSKPMPPSGPTMGLPVVSVARSAFKSRSRCR